MNIKVICKFTIVTALSSLIVINPIASFAQESIKVIINGEPLKLKVSPKIEKGTTLVPFRDIFEKLGMKVSWYSDGNIIVGEKNGLTIRMVVGGKVASVNDDSINLEVTPQVVNGSTLVPLRFVSEATGSKVNWDGKTQTVSITTSSASISRPAQYGEIKIGYTYLYKGDLVNGIPNGYGKLYNNGVLEAEGQFKDYKLNGQGKMYENGMVSHEGVFVNDMLNGKGKAYYIAGSLAGKLGYEGDFKEGLRSGQGKEYYDNGTTYEGQFYNDKPNGSGTIKFSDGSTYTGEVKDGKFDGTGTFTIKDGSKIVGQFKNGKLNGEGAMYTSAGVIIEQGMYKDDQLISTNQTPANGQVVVTNAKELQDYLNDKYPVIHTKIIDIKLDIQVEENDNSILPYDYYINFKYDPTRYYPAINSQRTSIKNAETGNQDADLSFQQIKDFVEQAARDAISKMPNKKIKGNTEFSWYRYPHIQVDKNTITENSWVNYEPIQPIDKTQTEASIRFDYTVLGYKDVKISDFQWMPIFDGMSLD